MSDTPVILLGLDAGDIVLIEQWAAQGLLPTFASLLSTAAHGRLETSAAVLQASVWPSFATACNPGKHGSYFLMQMRPGTHTMRRIRGDDLQRPPFWTYLKGPQETAVVIDVPKTAPHGDINGVQVVEWGTTDHYWTYTTVPTTLAKPLRREFGAHPLGHEQAPPTSMAGYLRLKKHLLQGVTMKHRVHLEFLARYKPRVFVSVFGEPHLAGHHFWRFTDPAHPAYCQHPQANPALCETYAALDHAVGEVFDRYSQRANCLVFSGHGMTADYQLHALIDALLCRMGLTVRGPSASTSPPATSPSRLRPLMKAMSKAVPQPIKRFAGRHVLPAGAREYFMLLKTLDGINFSRTQAFALPTDLQGFIRLNLQGREPEGTVPARRYESLCDSIVHELQELRDVDHGERVVETVFHPRSLYKGAENLDHLPDLCVAWKNTHPISKIYSPRYGTFEMHKQSSERSGNHRLEGFWFAAGPDIDTTVQHYRGQLYDIAATVFGLLHKPIPDDWDGTPLPIII